MKILRAFLKHLGTATATLLCLAPAILHAQSPPAGWTNLDSWSFDDTTNWTSDLGYPPISFTNIYGTNAGDGTSLLLDSTNPAWLQFPGFNSDGTTNLTVDVGSVSLWFSPNWASATTNNNGSGPGVFGRLLEVGAYTTNASYGWWSLFVDPGATNLYFATQTNSGDGATYTNLVMPINWTNNMWHNVILTYSTTNLDLYIDGILATNTSGLAVYPGLNVLTNSFWIGSDSNGVLEAHGLLDDIYTFNYPLDAGTVSNLYAAFYGAYVINPWNFVPAGLIPSASSSPTIVPTFDAVTGSGDLTALSTNTTSCISSSKVWITNITTTVSGTNMTVKFTIAGGSNGVPYDVFANSVLNLSMNTNLAWAWMGQGYQCVTYSLTVPSTNCFLVLGTPQDTSGSGLTDAYDELFLGISPSVIDASGDGMLDGWKVLWGFNPLTVNIAVPSERLNYTYDASGWLNQVSGVKSGSVSLDNEGNVLSVSE